MLLQFGSEDAVVVLAADEVAEAGCEDCEVTFELTGAGEAVEKAWELVALVLSMRATVVV